MWIGNTRQLHSDHSCSMPDNRLLATRRVRRCSVPDPCRASRAPKASSSFPGSPPITYGRRRHTRMRQADPRQLKDPAKIGGSSVHTVRVKDLGGPLSLDAYMRLPVQAYSELEPSMIFPLGDSSFLLKMPRISLFDLWVAPEVEVSVAQRDGSPKGSPMVVLESRSCHLPGSPFFSQLEGRFSLHFRTELTWTPFQQGTQRTARAAQPTMHGGSMAGGPPAGKQAPSTATATASAVTPRQQAATQQAQQGEIRGDLSVEVWAEPLPPFNLIPRPALEATCNAVVRSAIAALLPLFMRRLGEDYERWASDASYRGERVHAPPTPPSR